MVLKKVGYRANITMLKVILREIGFKWNGSSCNFTQFFTALRSFLHGGHGADCGV